MLLRVAEAAQRCRAHERIVLVVVPLAVVEVEMHGRLRGVAFHQEILLVEAGDDDLLVAGVEHVQAAVSVLLAEVEIGEVVLPLVVVPVPKEPRAKVRIVENEPAEIRNKWLDAEARSPEVVVVGKVAEVILEEQLLDADEVFVPTRVASPRFVFVVLGVVFDLRARLHLVRLRVHLGQLARSTERFELRSDVVKEVAGPRDDGERLKALARILWRDCPDLRRRRLLAARVVHSSWIGIEEVLLLHPHPVIILHHLQAEEPFHRLERRLAPKHFECQRTVRGDDELLAAPKKLRAVRRRCAHA